MFLSIIDAEVHAWGSLCLLIREFLERSQISRKLLRAPNKGIQINLPLAYWFTSEEGKSRRLYDNEVTVHYGGEEMEKLFQIFNCYHSGWVDNYSKCSSLLLLLQSLQLQEGDCLTFSCRSLHPFCYSCCLPHLFETARTVLFQGIS